MENLSEDTLRVIGTTILLVFMAGFFAILGPAGGERLFWYIIYGLRVAIVIILLRLPYLVFRDRFFKSPET